MTEKIRLKLEEIKVIKKTILEVLKENVDIYIFGSRADINKKGGDIS